MYERTGVTEYWIVYPDDKSVQGFFLNDDGLCGEPLESNGEIQSRLFDTDFRF